MECLANKKLPKKVNDYLVASNFSIFEVEGFTQVESSDPIYEEIKEVGTSCEGDYEEPHLLFIYKDPSKIKKYIV